MSAQPPRIINVKIEYFLAAQHMQICGRRDAVTSASAGAYSNILHQGTASVAIAAILRRGVLATTLLLGAMAASIREI